MAESRERNTVNSKIPRYIKTKVPILSKDYKETLKEVKVNQILIEKKEAELLVLLNEKTEICDSIANVDISKKDKDSKVATPYSKSEIRSVIQTPGGTKRKVRPSHVHFQSVLKTFLFENVRIVANGELKAEALLERLKNCKSTKAMSRSILLKEVSATFKRQLVYRGKKKEGYYRGLELIPLSPLNTEPLLTSASLSEHEKPAITAEFTSPASKIPKVDQQMQMQEAKTSCETELQSFASGEHKELISHASNIPKVSSIQVQPTQPSCKTKLSFEGGKQQTMPSTHVEDDVAKEKFQAFYHTLCKSYTATVSSFHDDVLQCDIQNKDLTALVKSMDNLLVDYMDVTAKIISNQQETIRLLKDIVDTGKLFGGLLSISERNQIKEEVCKTREIFNLGIREKGKIVDMVEILDPGIFQKLLCKLQNQCPTIMNILEQLVLSPNTSRNTKKTESVKMKASVHLLASLMDVRDQNAHNDIPLLFGLLCLCFGAGPSMIELLQHLGLSESHRVLCNVLKNQLVNYKELINRRAGDDAPIITYQDNMQLMRTSMRHLRLSKLQKDKLKQGKMWDFTVRGWRAADIEGIEELFEKDETSTKPQRDVATLQYKDTKIESNPEHQKKWEDFKERNILRKLNIGLNHVPIVATELGSAGMDKVKKIADDSLNIKKPKYIIMIPQVPTEFPHLSKKQTQIYPLPISHENQCKTLGLGRNLDMFSDEFGFKSKKEEKFLPLKKTVKEFNLDLAYTRFAFLKAMERHKEEQKILETTLRGDTVEQEDDVHVHQFVYVDDHNDSSDDEQ